MKTILYIVAFGLMIWALIEQTTEHPNIYIQIVAIVVFFYLMMQLMNRTPGKNEEQQIDNEDESGN